MNQKETLFTEKAKNYFVCFADQCPLHATCLRWEVGQYVDVDEEAILSMNPRNRLIAQGECKYYRNDEPVKMPVGMREIQTDMVKILHPVKRPEDRIVFQVCRDDMASIRKCPLDRNVQSVGGIGCKYNMIRPRTPEELRRPASCLIYNPGRRQRILMRAAGRIADAGKCRCDRFNHFRWFVNRCCRIIQVNHASSFILSYLFSPLS